MPISLLGSQWESIWQQPFVMNSAQETTTMSYLGSLVRLVSSTTQPYTAQGYILVYTGLGPHQDSSIDLLHTILLGLDKYVWHKTSSSWNEKKGKVFSRRLDLTSSLDG